MNLITSLSDERLSLYEKDGVEYAMDQEIVMASLRGALKREEASHRGIPTSVVCICGSTRFKQAWIAENARLTGEGLIVLAVGLWGHRERKYPDDETKKMLDELHLRKIDLCDWVWVLDVGGYIGESTRNEIKYAEEQGKVVRYLSREFPNYVEPIDPLKAALRERDEWKERAEDYKEVLDDKRRLTRELDVAMHGEKDAAKQASLCDLIGPAQRLRERAEKAEGALCGAKWSIEELHEKTGCLCDSDQPCIHVALLSTSTPCRHKEEAERLRETIRLAALEFDSMRADAAANASELRRRGGVW